MRLLDSVKAIISVILLVVVFVLIYLNDRAETRREVFEETVIKQHSAMHISQQEIKSYIDRKAADRFTGTQGREHMALIEGLRTDVNFIMENMKAIEEAIQE